MAKPTPTNIHELVEQLIQYEIQIKELTKKNEALTEMNSRARLISVRMHTRATKQSSFTNYEVKQYAKDFTDALTKMPLKK